MTPPSQAALFKALADENRIEIVKTIAKTPGVTANALLRSLNIAQSTLSHHMSVLREAKIINVIREGKWSHYYINLEAVDRIDRFANGLRSDRSQKARRLRMLTDLKRSPDADEDMVSAIDGILSKLT